MDHAIKAPPVTTLAGQILHIAPDRTTALHVSLQSPLVHLISTMKAFACPRR
ncbi:MAG TPA: hypothetical protein VNN81_01150 [Bradyrhizobium sp.]|nr:hypothetical protein [Bradyrhizobium sp.]